jgi:hypothetical protein
MMWIFDTSEAAEAAELAARATLDVDRDASGNPVSSQVTTRWADIIETEDGRFAIPERPGMAVPSGATAISDAEVVPKTVPRLD